MTTLEAQQEEIEVLASIYDGDTNFHQISSIVFQYKFGEEGTPKCFVLEIRWGEDYPNEKPVINMDTFFNSHIIGSVKQKITSALQEEAEQFLGCAMTYSLFEWTKEHLSELLEDQPDSFEVNTPAVERLSLEDDKDDKSSKAVKKEHLTKAQKRRQWTRMDGTGEKLRGWNWVDVIKHLSQTGPGKASETS